MQTELDTVKGEHTDDQLEIANLRVALEQAEIRAVRKGARGEGRGVRVEGRKLRVGGKRDAGSGTQGEGRRAQGFCLHGLVSGAVWVPLAGGAERSLGALVGLAMSAEAAVSTCW